MAKNSEAGAPDNQAQGTDGTAALRSTAPGVQGAQTVKARKSQYLVTARTASALQPMGLQPMAAQPLNFSFVEKALNDAEDIEVVDTLRPTSAFGLFADGLGASTATVVVARMSDQKASALHQSGQGQLIVEPDQPLTMHDPAFQFPFMLSGITPSNAKVLTTTIVVVDTNNRPIEGAQVALYGSLLPANGVTDANGTVALSLFGETPETLRALYVKPKSDFWSFFQQNPDISTTNANIVVVRPLSTWAPLTNFPQTQVLGWGQKAMRLDQVPSQYRGQGIRIAVIDSGAAALTHTDLKQIHFGFDILNKKDHPDTWTDDVIAHGSHCAGVIAGADNKQGVRGFAPDAEIHVCKLFPGGQISQLIDALEYCIEKQVDVVNLSLGGAEPSEALEQQILRAKRAGIACIVAAGNSGGAVQYPASSPNVLAVSAIGKLGEFPPDSGHTQTLTQFVSADGYFAAKFSCFGPEVGVCGPGVAIASSVPSDNYAVWDGTSMAAPHITGLAALVLAHHPDFQGAYKARSPERVERLFQIIKASSRRLTLGDAGRTGYGLPDTLIAMGLQPGAGLAQQVTLGQPIGGMVGTAQPRSVPMATPQMMTEAFAPQGWNPQFMPMGALQRNVQFDPAYAMYMNALLAEQQLRRGGIGGLFT
jgi:subtilisin family serine protease